MAKAEGRKKSGMILAGDVGGTKCNLALFQEDSNRTRLQLIFQRRYPTQDYAARSFQSMLQDFLGHAAKSEAAASSKSITAAGFGSAGAVVDGRFHSSNLPWVLEEHHLQRALGIQSVSLLNDLAAIAHGVPYLESSDLHVLNVGQSVQGGAIAVVAPGTGLGVHQTHRAKALHAAETGLG